MSTRTRAALTTALALVLLQPQGATAGGWVTHIDLAPSRVTAGQTVEVKQSVMFETLQLAADARRSGHFYAYVIRDFDYSIVRRAWSQEYTSSWWNLGGGTPIYLGPVELGRWNANIAVASATFVVPDLDPGRYHVMLCSARCEEPLADVIPAKLSVIADPATGQLTRRLTRVENRMGEIIRLDDKVDLTRDYVLSVRRMVFTQRVDFNALSDRVEVLAGRLKEAETSGPGIPWFAFLGWVVAGGVGAALVVRRRRDRVSVSPNRDDIDKELEEMKERVTI
jgi:hypothetical protein